MILTLCVIQAHRCLQFAIHFTPQYGDSFIELLRLHMIKPQETGSLDQIYHLCSNADPSYGALWSICKRNSLFSAFQVLDVAKDLMYANNPMLSLESSTSQYDISLFSKDLELRFNAIFGSGELQKLR